jgi:hypothetical protein
MGFILFSGDMVFPLGLWAVATAIVLLFPQWRRALQDRATLVAFLAVSLMWIALIPWAAAFVRAMDTRFPSPPWAIWPVWLVFAGWPFSVVQLVTRAKGARLIGSAYALLNVPGWLLGCFVAGMSITGDWI